MTQAVVFRGAGGAARLGRLEEGEVVDAGPAGAQGFVPTAPAWQSLRAADGRRTRLEQVELLAPVRPRQIVCVGLNYRDHAAEAGQPLPEAPLLFAKLPSAVIGPGEPIVVPQHEPQPDWEAELAVVIGAKLRHAAPEAALAGVGGYTALNDVSGRGAQFGDGQWTRGKSFDGFAPLGPAIGSPDGVDWEAVSVRCRVSGELMQDSTTAELIFGVPALVSYVSHQLTLEPGDVIATGTPSGVGFGRSPQRFLQDGDVVEVSVGALPPLINPVRR